MMTRATSSFYRARRSRGAEDGSSRAHAACFEALINAGADVDQWDGEGLAPIHHAAKGGGRAVLRGSLWFVFRVLPVFAVAARRHAPVYHEGRPARPLALAGVRERTRPRRLQRDAAARLRPHRSGSRTPTSSARRAESAHVVQRQELRPAATCARRWASHKTRRSSAGTGARRVQHVVAEAAGPRGLVELLMDAGCSNEHRARTSMEHPRVRFLACETDNAAKSGDHSLVATRAARRWKCRHFEADGDRRDRAHKPAGDRPRIGRPRLAARIPRQPAEGGLRRLEGKKKCKAGMTTAQKAAGGARDAVRARGGHANVGPRVSEAGEPYRSSSVGQCDFPAARRRRAAAAAARLPTAPRRVASSRPPPSGTPAPRVGRVDVGDEPPKRIRPRPWSSDRVTSHPRARAPRCASVPEHRLPARRFADGRRRAGAQYAPSPIATTPASAVAPAPGAEAGGLGRRAATRAAWVPAARRPSCAGPTNAVGMGALFAPSKSDIVATRAPSASARAPRARCPRVFCLGADPLFGQIVKAGEPVMSALVNTFFYGKPPSKAKFVCLLFIVGGVAFASLKKDDTGAYKLKFDQKRCPPQGAQHVRRVQGVGEQEADDEGGREGPAYATVANQFAVTEVLAFFISVPVMMATEGPKWGEFVELLMTSRDLQLGLAISGMSFYLYNELATMTIKATGAVTSSVANTAKCGSMVYLAAVTGKVLTEEQKIGAAIAIGFDRLCSCTRSSTTSSSRCRAATRRRRRRAAGGRRWTDGCWSRRRGLA